jgi:hypothetical protein
MKQIEYKGYAQRTPFDPIKAPDQTARIFAEGQRVIRGMQAVQDQDRRNRDAYASGLERKHALEKQNREANYDLDKNFRQKYQAAVLQNYRTRVEDANRNANDIERISGSLSAFSQTLAKKYGEYAEAKGEAEELAGYNAVFEMGITLDEYNQLKTLESEVDAFDQANNGLIASLKERGVGAEQINQFRQLSGRRQVGAMKAFAIQGADNYPIFRAENQDRMFTINGEEHSLNTAQNAGPAVWAAVNAQLRTEYLKQYRGLDAKFLNEYLFKGMREVENQEKVAFANQRSKALSAEFKEEQTNELVTDFKAGGAQGIMDWITRTSGGSSVGLRNQRLAAIGILQDMAKTGQFTAQDLDDLKALGVTLNGSSTPKAFGDLYGRDLAELADTIDSFNRKEYEQDKFELEQQKDTAERELHDYVTQNGPLSNEEKEQYEEWWRQTFKEHPPAGITKFTTSEELADKEADRILEAKARTGQLTTLELMTGRYSTALINKYRSFAQQGDSASKEFVTSTKKAVDQSLKQSLGELATNPESINGQFYMMQAIAHQDLESRAAKLMSKGATPEQAYQEAYQELHKDIMAGREGKGAYALRMGANGALSGEDAGFQALARDSGQQQSIRRMAQIRNRIAQDPMVIKKTNILTHDEVVAVKNVSKGGSIPSFIYAMNQIYPNMTPYELMDTLMESAGQQPITKPPSAAVYDGVRPQFRQLMTFRPSLARTAQAYSQSGGPGAPYQGLLDLIASKESSNDTVNGGYDSLNTGGSAGGHVAHGSGTGLGKFGRSLTEMTVGEVMDLQARGVLHATGRYQIIGGTLSGLVARGKASRSDLYDQATQDKLAIALIHGRAGKFFSGEVGAGAVVGGMGNEWIGLQYVKPQQLIAALETAKANINNPNFDVSRMKSSFVYKVGGIGPAGPGQYGPHLDIKQSNNKFFARQSLDNYIGFDTGAGVLPVSSGATVDGGEFGAPRSYGPHTGWDYAMPAGTKVILRNGAWVVGKVKTDYGDRLTVALPDGRRFNIIHGTAV